MENRRWGSKVRWASARVAPSRKNPADWMLAKTMLSVGVGRWHLMTNAQSVVDSRISQAG